MTATISQIKLFKACRRAYDFKYHEKLEPTEKAEALETGTNYHQLIEDLNNGQEIDPSATTKEAAMARAYQRHIFPTFKATAAEVKLEKQIGHHTLRGIVDGLTEDHIIEHKTTGAEITEEYEFNLQWDEQILAYMILTGRRKVWYTICRKPTIRQKADETAEEFAKRMEEWYETDTDKKIRLLEIERTDAEVEAFRKELEEIMQEMQDAENYYRNTLHCTHWGRRCEYASICLNYDPNQNYIGFQKWEADR